MATAALNRSLLEVRGSSYHWLHKGLLESYDGSRASAIPSNLRKAPHKESRGGPRDYSSPQSTYGSWVSSRLE
ncbi:hypothetical protein Nepgr_017611 [Nepenthes gracilis]|uniref:Uncharacterized protein n=1 Tax=Nepenthes gracilis TaxID=150966 RepID=A0AAD3SPP2_NEPGR|nr:hypothetical protein Nepgr_017611 [Nepenthes gracilis]